MSTYTSPLDGGQQLEVENEGETTHIGFSSGGSGQQQSQSRGFTTGKWTQPPTLFRSENRLILQLGTERGERFLSIRGNQFESLDQAPDLSSAEKVPMTEGPGAPKMKPMEPMKPMKPMEGMKPMEPMKPMKPF